MANFWKVSATVLFVVALAQPCRAEPKIRLAVLQFSSVGGGHDVGEAAEGWFVDSLVGTKKFQVMERTQLNAVMKELHFQQSGDVSAATAAKVGKLAGVQVVVFGNIHLAVKKQELHTSGLLPGLFVRLPSGGGSKTTFEGNVTARAVGVQTGEILFSKTETVSESTFHADIMGTGGGTEWDETVVRKIFQSAVDTITQELVAKVEGVREDLGSAASGEGKIVALKEGLVFLNLGKLDGVSPGDRYEIVRAEIISDPDTKEVLGRDETAVGTVVVEKLSGDHLCTAKILTGRGFVKGDIAKRK